MHAGHEPFGRPARDDEAEDEQPTGVDSRSDGAGLRIAGWMPRSGWPARQLNCKQGHADRCGIRQVVEALGKDRDRMGVKPDTDERAHQREVGDQDTPQPVCPAHCHRGPPRLGGLVTLGFVDRLGEALEGNLAAGHHLRCPLALRARSVSRSCTFSSRRFNFAGP